MVYHGRMGEVVMQASTFKARCLALLDEVARTRSTIVVTKHGKPVAKLVPIDDESPPTRGSVTLLVEDDEAYFSTGETWHAER
jgi:prevent-host-death family protein